MSNQVIHTDKGPAAVGPYSQAIKAGNLLFTSGQLGLVPATGEFAGPDVPSQTEQVMQNLKAILEEAGYTFQDVVKATCYLIDMADFNAMNEVYKKYFTGAYPARTAFAIKALPKGGLVEIEMVASK